MERHQERIDYLVRQQRLYARANLVLERIWHSARITLCLIGLFSAVSFIGLWESIHPILHILGLCGFAGAIGYSLYRFWMQFDWPSDEEALASLEARNGQLHRPLRSMTAEAVLDGNKKQASRHLWDRHHKQQQDIARHIKAGFPRLNLANGDRYSFRSAVILLITIGFFVGGTGAGARLLTAFTPKLSGSTNWVEVDVWASPPAYTRLPPRLLVRAQMENMQPQKTPVELPSGSKLVARVSGGNLDIPVLKYQGENHAFISVEGNNFELELPVSKSGDIYLEKDGDVLVAWQLNIIQDISPVVALLSLPDVTDRFAFRLRYSAADDYGVKNLVARMKFAGDARAFNLKLPIITGAAEVEGKSYHDLTAHPWAGFPVELTLIATDELGQKGLSKTVSFTLPERVFTHPIARALIEQRKKLVEDPVGNKADVAIALSAISMLPESLNNDFTVIMMLSTARASLIYGREISSVNEVIDILWDTALRLENGDLNVAEMALREAERALMEALNNGASDAEIKKLVEELKTAMNNFLQAFAQNQKSAPDMQASQDQKIDQQDLEKLLDRVDRFARSGARDAARELLSELQDILENLRTATARPPSSDQQAGQQMLNQLEEMMRRQQGLLDETFRRSRESNPQNSGQADQAAKERKKAFSEMAGRQEALRQMLGDLMGQLGLQGEIPETLGKAERSMNSARQELEVEDGRRAAEAQSKALDQLRQSAQGIAEQMMQGRDGQAVSGGRNGSGRDPLGRPMPNRNGVGDNAESNFKLQDNAISRAKLIQDELRRRLSDPSRGELERNYLRRLMERFR